MEAEWKAQIQGQQYLGEREEITVRQILENHLKASLAPATLKNARTFLNVCQRYINIVRVRDQSGDYSLDWRFSLHGLPQ